MTEWPQLASDDEDASIYGSLHLDHTMKLPTVTTDLINHPDATVAPLTNEDELKPAVNEHIKRIHVHTYLGAHDFEASLVIRVDNPRSKKAEHSTDEQIMEVHLGRSRG